MRNVYKECLENYKRSIAILTHRYKCIQNLIKREYDK